MKQSAVEWLVEMWDKNQRLLSPKQIIDKAKEMERGQIIEAFWYGDNSDCTSEQNSKEFAEQYYNKTFKKD